MLSSLSCGDWTPELMIGGMRAEHPHLLPCSDATSWAWVVREQDVEVWASKHALTTLAVWDAGCSSCSNRVNQKMKAEYHIKEISKLEAAVHSLQGGVSRGMK